MPRDDANKENEDPNPQRVRKGPPSGPKKKFGKHESMPVLATDMYKTVNLPKLEEFDPADIKLDGTIVCVGKRRTGKTWVFRNLMYLVREKFKAGIVISQTDELNKFWRDHVPEKYIYKNYDPSILEAVFRRQKRILNDKELTDEQKEEEARFFILLDDVISDQRLKYDEALMELFVAGRHYKIFVLITTQYAKAITPTLRGNTDYCFMMKCIQSTQLEALWEDYGSFLTKHGFARILDAYTEDNECLVVNTCPETAVSAISMLSWWKAIDPGEFKMGSGEFWKTAIYDPSVIPPSRNSESKTYLLTVEDVAPTHWKPFFSGR
jgi:hypothetical protein